MMTPSCYYITKSQGNIRHGCILCCISCWTQLHFSCFFSQNTSWLAAFPCSATSMQATCFQLPFFPGISFLLFVFPSFPLILFSFSLSSVAKLMLLLALAAVILHLILLSFQVKTTQLLNMNKTTLDLNSKR